MGQVVDTETAKEFMKETLERVDPNELSAICAAVEAKSTWFRETFARDAVAELSADDWQEGLRRVFSTRGKPRQQLAALDLADVRARVTALLWGPGEAAARFQQFADNLDGISDSVSRDFASELLHFADPEKNWLWTRWMWDPVAKTGALPLVTTAAYDLDGETSAEVYAKVGHAVAFVHEVGEAAGFQTISRNIFGTDVFLSCVYVVYAYTVLRMRMTQEFNKVMPGLPEFCRRLLGVHERQRPAP